MNLRKFNSISALLCIIFLGIYLILRALIAFGCIPNSIILKITGIAIIIVFIVHVVISLYQGRTRKWIKRTYPHIRQDTEVQVKSGFLIIILTVAHILMNYFGIGSYPLVIVDAILFIILGNHLRLSIPRLLVSMGFLTSKDSFDLASKIVRPIILIFIIIAIVSDVMLYIM